MDEFAASTRRRTIGRVELEGDRQTLAALVGAAAPPPSERGDAAPHRAPSRPGRFGGGPAAAGPAAGTSRGLRLHRRSGRRGDRPAPVQAGVRPGGVPAAGAARRLGGGHVDDDPRATVRAAARLRPHRVHPHDAHRRRAGSRPRGGPHRDPVRAVHDGHHLHRGARRPRRPAEGSGSSSISGATGRPAGTSSTRAREAGYEALMLTVDTPVPGARLRDVRNGLTIPPSLSAADLRRGSPASRLVVRPADDGGPGVRVPHPFPRAPSPSSSGGCSTRR